jgi:hypothetical protein
VTLAVNGGSCTGAAMHKATGNALGEAPPMDSSSSSHSHNWTRGTTPRKPMSLWETDMDEFC